MDYSYNDLVSQFVDEMRSKGLGPQDSNLIGDGEIHKYDIEGDRAGKKAGWYVLHLDEKPNGIFRTYRDPDVTHKWFPKQEKKLSSDEKKQWEKNLAEKQRKFREKEKEKNEHAKNRALEIWKNSPVAKSHPYLDRKSVASYGLRVGERGDLIIALKNSNQEITSLQFIDTAGDKIFLPGGVIKGSYFSILGNDPKYRDTFLICEGYATGATLREATGFPVVVAFNAGNLEAVALTIREKFPDAKIIICGDNDQYSSSGKNAGLEYGRKAAAAISAYFCFPEFPADDQQRRTDFNDLGDHGEIRRIIEATLSPPAPAVTAPVMSIAERTYNFIHIINDWPFTKGRDQKPITNIENITHLLKLNGISVNYDVIKKDLRISIPGETYLIDTEKNDKFSRITSIAESAGLTNGNKVADYVGYIGNQNPINPVAEWIESKPWDGVGRLEEFLKTIKSVDEDDPVKLKLKNTLILKWMISAVAAAYRPNGVSAHGVLVFTGDQYVGKTNWFKSLVPQELRLTKDGMMLDPKDKDSVYQIVSNWIVELGEIDATFRKADIAQLKAFITKDEDILRLPYARSTSQFSRRTVFFASVNDKDYLSDPTGNRRFWTIEVADINHSHGLNMQQVWAEILIQYKKGVSYFLNAEEMSQLNEHNKDYEVVSPVEELLESKYNWGGDFVYTLRNLTATEIAIELGFKNPLQRDIRSIARSLRRKKIETVTAKGRTLYRVPSLKIEQPSEQKMW